MAEKPKFGYRVVGTIVGLKGSCNAGHKVGDRIELSAHDTGGLCGFLYHDVFPYVLMLQFGGSFPADWGDQDAITLDCMDKYNQLTIELRRIRE